MGASGRHVERDNKPGRLLWPPVPVGGAVTDFTIIRSRRRTMALQISRDGLVVVRAPQLLAEEEIYRFVAEHDWIRRNRQKQADRESSRRALSPDEISALRQQALQELPPLVERWACIMGVKPTGIKITGARTRWGSCSGRNSLCFSLYLMQYPPEVVEAVVVHELAHIRQKNHGPAFYQEVERWMPDYRQRAQRLKEPAPKK